MPMAIGTCCPPLPLLAVRGASVLTARAGGWCGVCTFLTEAGKHKEGGTGAWWCRWAGPRRVGLAVTCSKSSTVYLEGKAGGGGGLARPLSWQATGMLFTERPVL